MRSTDTAIAQPDTRTHGFLVLGGLNDMGPLALRSACAADRLLARVLGATLDRQLAAGRPPESARLLAVRAQDVVSLPRRRKVARNWDHLLRVAHGGARTPAAPLCADQIIAAEAVIRALTERLTAPLPVAAHGVAAASILLTDATGPVYNRHSPVSLIELLGSAIAGLDPAVPLTGP